MNAPKIKIFLSSFILCLSFGLNVSYAVDNNTPTVQNNNNQHNMPHVYLSGSTGSGALATGDMLQPLWLQSDRNLFFYGQGNYSYADEDWAQNPWTGSAGFGYRQIGNNVVYGFFVLGDYTHTLTDHAVWQVSPGLEILGRAWQFHANGYIPVSNKDWTTTGFADEFGNYDYVRFNGHNQYDAKFRYHEEAGSGADAEIGRTLFKCHNTLVTGLINGYYFLMRDNNSVRGGGASIDVQPTDYLKLFVNGSYDNYAHTQVMLGFQVSIYDLFSGKSRVLDTQDLHRKLFDPIDRNFANITSGSTTRATGGPGDRGMPEVITWYEHNSPERTNIWFFDGSNSMLTATGVGSVNSLADGTYEHPFTSSDFNQNTVTNIHNFTVGNGFDFAYLYFSQGMYNAYSNTTGYNPIEIFPGESLWGRMGAQKGFAEPATGNSRALFYGGFQLDSNTSVNNIRLQNSSMANFATGIMLNGATNVGINDSQVGIDGPGSAGYHTGVTMQNYSVLTISGSNVFGYNSLNAGDERSNGVGLEVKNGGNVTALNHSLIKGTSVNRRGIGLFVATNAAGNAVMGNIDGDKTAIFMGISNQLFGYGFFAGVDVSNVQSIMIGNISNSNFTGIGGNAGFGFRARTSISSGSSSIKIGNIFNSTFTGRGGNSEDYGMFIRSLVLSGSSNIQIGNISNSTFTGTGGLDANYGMFIRSRTLNGTSNVQIGDISNSRFLGIGGNATESSSFGFNARIIAMNSNMTIGNISDSNFTGIDNGATDFSIADGFLATSGISTGVNGILRIGNISNSHFTGAGGLASTESAGTGFLAFSNSATGTNSIWIGDISNSTFTGTAANASTSTGRGLQADNSATTGTSSIRIGNITNSQFTGTGNRSGEGLLAGGSNTNILTIGTISGSSFTGTGGSSGTVGYGMSLGGDSITITNIANSNFNAAGVIATGLNLTGTVTVAGMAYANGTDLYNYLITQGNGFSAPGGNNVCVNGLC